MEHHVWIVTVGMMDLLAAMEKKKRSKIGLSTANATEWLGFNS